MHHIKAIGFDFFNTLITADPRAVTVALSRLSGSLHESGLYFDDQAFYKAYREAAVRFITESEADGVETHNRFWISAALEAMGLSVNPEDDRIARGVEAYFTAFYDFCALIPGTAEMLGHIAGRYRLGLLSNFTHAPAARKLLDLLGLTSYFDAVLISGDLGYRKPHPYVFQKLLLSLGVKGDLALFVGDDPEPDIKGALRSGLQPVWMTYVQDHHLPSIPGYLRGNMDGQGDTIPRISTWKDFISLLG